MAWRTGVSALLVLLASPSFAHNPDTSYLRCVLAQHALDLRFTFDIATLFRIVRPDADGDGRVSPAELVQITPEVYAYLEKSVALEINGAPAAPGMRGAVAWPPGAGDAIAEKDYHQVLVHFPLRVESAALIEDFYANYDVFDELGDSHRVIADVEQGEGHHEIIFTQFEPDYLYDTGWLPSETVEPPLFKSSFESWVGRLWNLPGLMIAAALVSIVNLRRWIKTVAGLLILAISWKLCLTGSPPQPVWLAGLASVLALSLVVLVSLPVKWLLEGWRMRPS